MSRKEEARRVRTIIRANPHITLADVARMIGKSVRYLKILLTENPG